MYLSRVLVHSPNAARAFGGLGHFIRHQSRLDPRLREMAILQVGYLARSPYEWPHHEIFQIASKWCPREKARDSHGRAPTSASRSW